jgi:hypothetical protein
MWICTATCSVQLHENETIFHVQHPKSGQNQYMYVFENANKKQSAGQ